MTQREVPTVLVQSPGDSDHYPPRFFVRLQRQGQERTTVASDLTYAEAHAIAAELRGALADAYLVGKEATR